MDAVNSIGLEAFLVYADAMDSTPERVQQHIVTAASPLFFIDFLVSDPIKCCVDVKHALGSVGMHWLFLSLPAMIPVGALTIYGCSGLDAFDEVSALIATPSRISSCNFGRFLTSFCSL